MIRTSIILVLATAFIGCSTTKVKETSTAEVDSRSIDEIFEELPEMEAAEFALEAEDLDEDLDPALSREQIRSELQSLKTELASKEAQLGHFQMLDDNLWKNQTDVLRGEIDVLRNRKADLEQQLQQMSQ